MTALDALLDSPASHHEIALWLGISEQAVTQRYLEREVSASLTRKRIVKRMQLAAPQSASGED